MGNTSKKSGEELTNLPEGKGVVIMAPEPPKQGRPTDYSDELADSICALIAEGNSLRSVVRRDDMPAMSTAFKWLGEHSYFTEQYTRAKEESADSLSDEIQDIADQTLKGKYDPQASRVAIDAYKWTASKLKPKKYGDKIDHTTNGKDLPTPILGNIPLQNAPDDVLGLT